MNYLCEINAVKVTLLILLGTSSQSSIIINKCCKEGMIFRTGLECVNIPGTISLEEFSWFPTDAIIDMNNSEVTESRRNHYLKILKKSIINFGKWPSCEEKDIDSTTFTRQKPLFHFLLYNDSHMDTYVASNKTLHHFSHAHQFPVIENENGHEWKGLGKELRADEVDLRTFSLDNICVDGILNQPSRHRLLICPCNATTCIRKCCYDGHYYNVTKGTCEPMEEISKNGISKWRPRDIEKCHKPPSKSTTADGVNPLYA